MDGSDGESACRIPWEGEGGIVSATVVHVEEELLRIETGGLGGEGGLVGVVNTGRMIEHQRRAIGRLLIIKTTRAVREVLHEGGEGMPDGRDGKVI
jgi:hypothetical protein